MIRILLTSILLLGIAADTPGSWRAVFPYVDLETEPLEIETNSKIGSGDNVFAAFYTLDGDLVGSVSIKFSSTPSYQIQDCMDDYADFSISLPSDDKKVWRITRSRDGNIIKIQIHCNEVEVLNFVISGDTCMSGSDWSNWNREVARVTFYSIDTASESYRGGSGSWTAVFPYVDLETVPLEIETDSKIGSEDLTMAQFSTLDGEKAGGVEIRFSSTPKYIIKHCMDGYADFLVSLPSDDKKVWRITRSRDVNLKIQIHCNEVEVLNFVFSGDTCDFSDWGSFWDKEVAKIYFRAADTASDSYRGGSACSAGNYMTGSGCQQCGENTYSGARAFSCTNCPSDEVSAAGSTSESDCASESEEHYQYSAGSSAWCSYIIGIVLAALFSIHIV